MKNLDSSSYKLRLRRLITKIINKLVYFTRVKVRENRIQDIVCSDENSLNMITVKIRKDCK